MELLFRIVLFLAGLINFLPSLLAFFPGKFKKSYGVVVSDQNLALLLRHRAVMFGIVGGIMIFSAINQENYKLSTIVGLISMLSFVMLYFNIGHNIGVELKKIMWIDLIASIVLLIVFLMLP